MVDRLKSGDLVSYLVPGGPLVSGRYVGKRGDKIVVALSTGGRAIVPPAWVIPGDRSTAPL